MANNGEKASIATTRIRIPTLKIKKKTRRLRGKFCTG